MGGPEIKAALGINIKNIRSFRQYSQAELAERADISVIYLSNIERGVKYPKPAILSQIAEGLGVEVYELFKTDHVPSAATAAAPRDNKKLINRLSKEMTQKVMRTMEGVFSHYLK
ncbi:MAG: helix-turn-helix domain-containing protein [Treponema sp.]|jgi:transcriptional regulator with XRE-family HTH domain|nr:helix-turn-helix domain-containing protein [Treponema sp.]